MKHLKPMLWTLVTVFCYSLLNSVYAQANLGAGVSYGTGIERAALNIRAGYLFGERLNLEGDVNIFGVNESGNTETRWIGYNLNGSYRFRMGCKDKFIFYPLAGVNLTAVNTEASFIDPDGNLIIADDTETEWGVNLGGGFAYQFNRIIPFVEGKYVTGDLDQGVFTAGLLYVFSGKK